MCGRFAFYSPSEATAALFGFDDAAQREPRYNIAPTQMVSAGRHTGSGDPEIVSLRWGLIPFWAKDRSIGNRMINARAETVATKPAFRAAFKERRCIIPADDFFEWRKEPHGKTPFFISLAGGEPFAFAGLWDSWTDRASGESLQTTTILTTAASEFLSGLHDRMPVVLSPDDATRWLDGEDSVLDEPAAGAVFRAWPVSRRVNQAANEGADLVEPVGPELPRQSS